MLQRSHSAKAALALLSLGTSMLALASPAQAQEAETAGEDAAEDAEQAHGIVVTGSRIVRRDFEATSPILSVDSTLLEQSSTVAIEQNLNKLPQFTPAKTPTLGGDIQPTSQNTPGSATISLRGIGSNRNLVLIDGRRGTPSNASQVVDVNTIPSAAIERVEIISGGASSTYGADAVGGVVNFILKKNFVGLELDGHTSLSQEGDGFEYQLSGIMGADFADGRGNVSIAMSTNKREASFQGNRDWYRELWADPTIGGTDISPPFFGFNTGRTNLPDPAVLNAVIDGANFTSAPASSIIFLDFDGNAFSGFDTAGVPGTSGFANIDSYRYKMLANGQIGANNVDNYLFLPLTRYNMYARGSYEVNDWLSVFGQAIFSNVATRTLQSGASVRGGWGATIDPTINRDILPAELLTILDSRPDPDAPVTLQGRWPLPRASKTEVNTYNMTAGLSGFIPDSDWTFEIFASQGESSTFVRQTGFASLERFRTLLAAPNLGRGFTQQGNPESGGFGASSATCTSGFNVFQPETISQDCYEAVSADLKTRSKMQQNIWEANLQGKLMELPAGELRAAVGASYRENDYEFLNDTLSTQGRSFLDQVLGLYPSGNSVGSINVKEVYGELLVPVFAHHGPWFQELNLELGGRISDYNTTGTSYTYKALAELRMTDWLRLRGGYNRAERAPNIAELYLAPEQTFAVAAGGDVCSVNNGLAYSANPEANANYAQALALCGQLMEASGDPTADEQYYGVDYRELVAAAPADVKSLVTTPQGSGASFVFPTLVGNAALRPETADTWTAGAVITSPFTSPALANLRLAIDYYNIKVTDAIGAQSVDIVQRQCFDAAFNPELDPGNVLCAGVDRNQTGALGNVIRTFLNNGRFKTSGVDVQLDWALPVGPGRLSLNSVFNYLIDMKTAELPTDPLVEYAGSQGPSNNGLDGSSYRWKLLANVGYSFGPASIGLQWRHLPSIRSQTSVLVPDSTSTGVTESYDLFGLQGRYDVTENATLRFGVENLLNTAPPLSGRNPGAELPSLPGGGFDSQNYDTFGRSFYLGANLKF